MKCPFCGFENPDRSSFCNSCGKEITTPAEAAAVWSQRNCVACGRTIPNEANVCPYCGHDYRFQFAPLASEAISSGMRILFYILSLLIPIAGFIIGAIYYSKGDAESRHVGKMCLILAVVGILIIVGLAASFYVLVVGFDGYVDGQTPTASLTRDLAQDGVRFTFTPFSKSTTWSDITIMLSDGIDVVDWSPSTAHLSDQGSTQIESFAPTTLSGMTLYCNVTDLMGNGYVNQGDFFRLTTGSAHSFSPSVSYTITIMYDPSGGMICQYSFNG